MIARCGKRKDSKLISGFVVKLVIIVVKQESVPLCEMNLKVFHSKYRPGQYLFTGCSSPIGQGSQELLTPHSREILGQKAKIPEAEHNLVLQQGWEPKSASRE